MADVGICNPSGCYGNCPTSTICCRKPCPPDPCCSCGFCCDLKLCPSAKRKKDFLNEIAEDFIIFKDYYTSTRNHPRIPNKRSQMPKGPDGKPLKMGKGKGGGRGGRGGGSGYGNGNDGAGGGNGNGNGGGKSGFGGGAGGGPGGAGGGHGGAGGGPGGAGGGPGGKGGGGLFGPGGGGLFDDDGMGDMGGDGTGGGRDGKGGGKDGKGKGGGKHESPEKRLTNKLSNLFDEAMKNGMLLDNKLKKLTPEYIKDVLGISVSCLQDCKPFCCYEDDEQTL